MTWSITDDLVAYRAAAWSFLAAEPDRYSVLLTVLSALGRIGTGTYGDRPPVSGWWPAGGPVRAAVLQTPPRPMLITSLPGDALAQLAAALAGRGTMLPGVNGSEQDAAAFAAAWQRQTGAGGSIAQRHRLYRLGELRWPEPRPAGSPRVAGQPDTEAVREIYAAFAEETGQDGAPGVAQDRLAAGQLMLWEVAGEPAALAGTSEVIAGTARGGPVYTPPELRGCGYGGAVTAAVSELARRGGAESVILFTDLANPTSNALYARLGYRPVEDRVVLLFGA
ncbi:MAG: GNAT family N-acetyltransferase [Streptosporangiaceae bacterium]